MGHSSNQTRRRQQMKQQESENVTFPHHTGTWIWDYNVYHNNNNNNSSSASPTASTTTTTTAVRSSSNNNNLLLTQIASSRSLQELSDISSLPNRAYARQWRRDYVQILCASTADRKQQQQESSSLEEKSCFAKVFVLQWLLQKHNDTTTTAAAAAVAVGVDTANGSSRSSSNNGNNKATTKTTTTMTTTTVPYDTVALLPPDAIVTDLDYDLEQLLPADKLVAIAGDWQQQIQKADDDKDNGKQILAAAAAGMTDVVFFNLRHKHAAQVVQLWFDAVANPNHHVTCEAGNDLQLLFEVMRSVVQNDEDKFQSMIHSLIQTEQGFIMGGTNNNNNNKKDGDNNNNNNNRVIKSITPQVIPAYGRLSLLLADMANSRAVLQTTADSVCYRYYPKCEVL